MDRNTELVAYISILLATTLFVSITILEQNQHAHTPFALADDFEQFPKNWVIETVESGKVLKSSEEKLGGLFSAHLYSPNTTDVAGAYLPISAYIKDLHISLGFYVDYSVIPDHMYLIDLRGPEGVQSRIVVNDVNGTCNVCILGISNGYDPASYQVVTSITRNVWHRLELDVFWLGESKVLDIRVDDSDFGFYSPHDSSVIVDRLHLGDSTVGGFKGSLYFDDLIIEGPFY